MPHKHRDHDHAHEKKKHQDHHKQFYSLEEVCTKSVKILHEFMRSGSDMQIPAEVLSAARGIAILRIVRAGLHFSGRGGKGLVLARLPDGTWSAPAVVAIGGAGAGLMMGIDFTYSVMILNSDAAVAAFTEDSFSLGGNIAVAVGPVGRAFEAGAGINTPPVFSYSQTKGLYVGISMEGTVIKASDEANKNFYGRPISIREILGGAMPRPQVAAALYEVLEESGKSSFENIPHPPSSNESEKSSDPNSVLNRVYTQRHPPSYEASESGSSRTAGIEAAGPSSRPLPTLPELSTPDATFFAIALYDYKSTTEGDLELTAGETIRVTKRNADGWWFGNIEKREGLFPSTYVRPL
ncbi:hypothetical protein BDR26DRAFT_858622 [Obelidium mucronatum]|nr:hypothetical protein BDR26DRAFT_858622 [Obelidium mucronatum]